MYNLLNVNLLWVEVTFVEEEVEGVASHRLGRCHRAPQEIILVLQNSNDFNTYFCRGSSSSHTI